MSGFLLRDIRAADFEILYRLDQDCFDPGIAYSRRELREFLSLSSAVSVAAESRGTILGFIIGYVGQRRLGHVVTLDVVSEHRLRGVGRALLNELVGRLQAESVGEVRLEVDARNESAIRFYERFGFRKTRPVNDYYGPGRPAWKMSLPLSPRLSP